MADFCAWMNRKGPNAVAPFGLETATMVRFAIFGGIHVACWAFAFIATAFFWLKTEYDALTDKNANIETCMLLLWISIAATLGLAIANWAAAKSIINHVLGEVWTPLLSTLLLFACGVANATSIAVFVFAVMSTSTPFFNWALIVEGCVIGGTACLRSNLLHWAAFVPEYMKVKYGAASAA